MSIEVSIIVPVYNAEKYLSQMIGSILDQSFQDFEVICVDDGSTDQSCAVIEELEAKDSRIRLLHKKHTNAGEARNVGMDAAKGTYLMFLDADDFFEPEMLEECVAKLEEEQSDLVIFSANQYNEKTGEIKWMFWSLQERYLPEKLPFAPEEMKGHLFNAFQNWPWNKMFRRSYIEGKNIRYQSVQRTNDMAFVCEAMARADKISIIKKPFANYRVGTESSSQATNHYYPTAFWDAFLETKRRLEKAGLYAMFQQSFLNWVMEGTLVNINSNRQEYARIYARSRVKFEGEREFEFLKYGKDYYHEPSWYEEYHRISKAETPPELEQLKASAEDLRNQIKTLEKRCESFQQNEARLRNKLHATEKELNRVLTSNSYQLGRMVSFPYRKIKQVITGNKK